MTYIFNLFTHCWDHLIGTLVTDSSVRKSSISRQLGISNQPNHQKGYLASSLSFLKQNTEVIKLSIEFSVQQINTKYFSW